jgi:transcription initiation factor TFIIIB Brf1 subunit/transcription initiation factor TFIIB
MAQGIFDGHEIEVPCPKCGQKTKKTIGWLRDHAEMICAGCGVTIVLKDEGFRAGLDQADEAMKKVRAAFAGFGKRK